MSLNYDKLKSKSHGAGDFWTSYADLATVLTTIFLAMYAVATLRSMTMSVAEQVAKRATQKEMDDLRNQIQAFEVLKNDYMARSASDSEKKAYSDLLNQMRLLETDAKRERADLQQRAKDADEKAKGLNRYQAVIKNIITANMLSQEKLKAKDNDIARKAKTVAELRASIRDKEAQVESNRRQVETIQNRLEKSIARLKLEQKDKTRNRKAVEEKIARMRRESEDQVRSLEAQNEYVQRQLVGTKRLVTEKEKQVSAKEKELAGVIQASTAKERQYETRLASLEDEKNQAVQKLSQQEADFEEAIAKREREYRDQVAAGKREFDEQLAREKLTAEEKVKREQAYRAQVEREKQQYVDGMRGLSDQLEGTRKAIADRESKFQSEIARVEGKAQNLQQTLGKIENEKRGLAQTLGQLEAEKQGLAQSLGKVEGEKRGLAQALGKVESEKQGLAQTLGKVEGEKDSLAREVAENRRRQQERKRLAQKIQDAFRKGGVDASIDPKTGDVTLNFAGEYFDYGSHNLKPGMSKILEKAMPLYAKSLFDDPELAKKITSVEIIGFASPTFKGKYVDPRDLRPEARRAVNYNLDLSYQRAKAIFEYTFDPTRMVYQYQKELLSLAKVTGRGYLRANVDPDSGKSGAKVTDDEYCQKFDCTKSQRVLIKFNFAEKE